MFVQRLIQRTRRIRSTEKRWKKRRTEAVNEGSEELKVEKGKVRMGKEGRKDALRKGWNG